MRNQLGKITTGTIIFVLLFVLALDTCFRIVPVYIHYLTFKNDIKGRALDIRNPNTDLMKKNILKEAEDLELPIQETDLLVEMTEKDTHVKADWTMEIRLLGGYYPYKLAFLIDSYRPNISS